MAERYLKRKSGAPTKVYFFIDRRLHRVLKRNIPANLVEAWSFEDNKRVTLLYTDFKKKATLAYRTGEAAKFLNISRRTLEKAVWSGAIREPVRSYPIGEQMKNNSHWWGLWNILEAHEYLLTVHYGRPRKDGRITPNQKLPTRAEVIARVNNEVVLFSKEDAQLYRPLYSPPTF